MPSGKPLRPDQRREIVKLLKSKRNYSTHSIADWLSLNQCTVEKVAREEGLQRKAGGKPFEVRMV